MSIGNVILGVLGLAPQFAEAEAVISGTKAGVEAIMAAKELLTSPDGEKFKQHIIELIGGSHEVDGKVHFDAQPTIGHISQDMVWAWKDSLYGWALVLRSEALKQGWPIYGE